MCCLWQICCFAEYVGFAQLDAVHTLEHSDHITHKVSFTLK